MTTFKNIATYLFQASLWPAIMAAWIGAVLVLLAKGFEPVATYVWVYYTGLVLVFLLELALPYSLKWRKFDDQWINDIVHTTASRVVGSLALRWAGVWFTIYVYGQFYNASVWEGVNWWLELAIALLICDLGRYIYHRAIHERWGGWVFHSLHHSAKRLWVGNTARTHFVDGAFFVLSGFVPLFALQFSAETIFWCVVLNSFIGTLSHCNIKMRPGIFNYMFNTPILHRWHHSTILSEGNRNYGQLFCFWDHVFGTYYNPPKDPENIIGVRLAYPNNVLKQFYFPFGLLFKKNSPPWMYIGEKKAKRLENELGPKTKNKKRQK